MPRASVSTTNRETVSTNDFIGLYKEHLGFLLEEEKVRLVPVREGYHGLGQL